MFKNIETRARRRRLMKKIATVSHDTPRSKDLTLAIEKNVSSSGNASSARARAFLLPTQSAAANDSVQPLQSPHEIHTVFSSLVCQLKLRFWMFQTGTVDFVDGEASNPKQPGDFPRPFPGLLDAVLAVNINCDCCDTDRGIWTNGAPVRLFSCILSRQAPLALRLYVCVCACTHKHTHTKRRNAGACQVGLVTCRAVRISKRTRRIPL